MNFGGKIIYETLSDIVAGRRLIAQRGGTRSGKTYSILLCLSVSACKRCVAIDIVSESLPHLKRGAIHDFDEILQRENLPVDINKTDRTYTFQSGSVVRFFSADDWGKVKGSRRSGRRARLSSIGTPTANFGTRKKDCRWTIRRTSRLIKITRTSMLHRWQR